VKAAGGTGAGGAKGSGPGAVGVGEGPDRFKQLLGSLDLREMAGPGEQPEVSSRDGGSEGAAKVGVADPVGLAP
jgi:hypothetical protein